MADEVPTGATVVEPEPTEPPPPEPPPDAVAAAPPKDVVPLAALQEVRKEAHELKQQLSALAANNQRLQQALLDAQPKPAASADPLALEVARALDLYSADPAKPGPDAARGAQVIETIKQLARQEAASTVQPLAHSSARERSAANYHALTSAKMPDGKPIDATAKQYLDWAWKNLPPEQTADQNVAMFLFQGAVGSGVLASAPGVPAPPHAPTHSEPSGGRAPQRSAPLSDLERRVAQDRKVPEQEWAKQTQGFTAGRPFVLEDD